MAFFPQTYARVLGNDDRAAEEAAAFLLGNAWGTAEEPNR
jgi:hypothetical protein